MDRPYAVIFTGELAPGVDVSTAASNVVLTTGISSTKAAKLFGRGPVLLKHFASAADAERLADKFYQAGVICEIRDARLSSSNPGAEVGGESSLVRMLKHFTGNGAHGNGAKRKQA